MASACDPKCFQCNQYLTNDSLIHGAYIQMYCRVSVDVQVSSCLTFGVEETR